MQKQNDTVKFGSYPQRRVYDADLLEKLNAAAGALPAEKKPGNWTSYRFYMDGEKSDYMWYIDVELDGGRYRGVYIKKHRPYNTDESNDGHQGYLGYYTKRTYWFAFEPIEFGELRAADGGVFAFSRYVLDAMQLGNGKMFEYITFEDSEIREWLNGEFAKTAFSDGERARLLPCDELGDAVSLLNADEYTEYVGEGGDFRKNGRKTTDYARCMGVNAECSYGLCNFYWLRTVVPDEIGATFYGVGTLGSIDDLLCCYAGDMSGGVAMCVKIKPL